MSVFIERGAFYDQRHDFPVTFVSMVLHSLRPYLPITTELIIMIQIHEQISPWKEIIRFFFLMALKGVKKWAVNGNW